ncbi:MAG: CRISPR system precrRNA processing endoribonuclease RAMP protein Cas6 [Pseudonocardiaceae bacterium]
MPTLLTLRLTEPAVPPFPAHLHAAACGLLEPPDADHTAQRKPFAVGAPVTEQGFVMWRLGWLPDRALPAAWPPQRLRLGGSTCQVFDAQTRHQPFAALAASRPVTQCLVRFLTPTYFSRNGRDVPLPDPVLILRSLTQRWNTFAPAGLTIDDTLSKELLATALLTDADVHTVRVQVGHDAWQTGFVGDTELALTRTASPDVGAVFTALLRYATVAGVGARTTHGFGEVSPQPPDERPRTRHTDADPHSANPPDPASPHPAAL